MKNALIAPLSLGSARFANNLFMAPIAGTTSAPFRTLCRRFGAGLTYGELTSAAGILHDPELAKNRRYLAMTDEPSADAVQLFGAEPAQMAAAVRRLLQDASYRRYAVIDINMGCPVPKVMKTGAGAALMGDEARAAELVRQVVAAAAGKPVTVKIRSGLDDNRINAVSFARAMQAAGAAAVTVHARTARQGYAGRADYALLRAVRDVLTVPLIGSGDLADVNDLRRMREEAGVDAFMVGRAAIGNPWLFAELLTGRPVGAKEKASALILLTDGLIRLLGEKTALAEVRPQLAAAVRGRSDAAAWRRRLFEADSPSALFSLIQACFGCADCTMPL